MSLMKDSVGSSVENEFIFMSIDCKPVRCAV